VIAYFKNATNKYGTSLWNSRYFAIGIAATAAFFVFLLITKILKGRGKILPLIALGVLSSMLLLHAAPDVIGYPYVAQQAEETMLTTDYLFKIIGIALGVLLCCLIALAVRHCVSCLEKGLAFLFLTVALILNAVRLAMGVLHVAISKRWIQSTKTYFRIVKFYTNGTNLFISIGIILCAAVIVILYVRSLTQKEPYANPAQHRKIRAKWRNIRRWATLGVVCFICVGVNLTVVSAYNNRAVELSPVEDCDMDDEYVYVSTDKLADGHLHRFAITSDDGIQIRFIAIQKTNGTSYGVGMDACEICGQTGYYEKDDQVVCKLCDVAMNVNTIGFKGGCNPLIVDYEVKNGNIVIAIDDLLEFESTFK